MFLWRLLIKKNKMTNKYMDLHTHTIFSDGLDNPETLIRNARLSGTDVLAITDHDTMAGYFSAKDIAKKWGIALVPGVEISTRDYHILGLNVNPENEQFQNFLQGVRDIQDRICAQRIELLQKDGVPITLDKLKAEFPNARRGKYNLFMTLLLDEECKIEMEKRHPGMSPDWLFTHYLRSKGIAGNIEYKNAIKNGDAIRAIHESGGIAVLAHPPLDIENMSELDILVEEGIDGLEIQSRFAEKNPPFREYALNKGLIITYGSDYHGSAFARPLLGRKANPVENLNFLYQKQKGYKFQIPS